MSDSLRAEAGDSLGAAADSLAQAVAGTLETAARDSMHAARMDSFVAPATLSWDPAWLRRQLSFAACETLLARADLAASSGQLLSDALERESPLGVFRSGSHGAWDQPYVLGPGAERLSLWDGGVVSAGPAVPEAHLLTRSLLAVDRLLYVAPDPLLDPLASGGDALLWCENDSPVAGPARSAVRLTEGPGSSDTEDFLLSRRSGEWGLLATYAHSRSAGRPYWIQPRYSSTRYQNLGLAFERSLRWGAFRIAAADRAGRTLLEPGRKLVWSAQRIDAGWQARGTRLASELTLVRRNDLLRWWGDEGADRRWTTSTEARANLTLRLGPARLLFAAAAEQVSLTFTEEGRYARDAELRGMGLAIGMNWLGERRAFYAIAGETDPWWGKRHTRAHALAAQRLGCMTLTVEGYAHATAPFTPRLDGDGRALLEEGLLLADGSEVEACPLRKVRHGELRLAVNGASGIRAGAFARDVRDALGSDPARAGDLAPEARGSVPAGELLGDIQYRAASLGAWLGLPLGVRIAGDATYVFEPGRQELPVLVARYRARAIFAMGQTLFKGDLRLEGRLVGLFRDAWTTPYGESASLARYDAELHGRFGRADFFLAVRNLANEQHDAATYADGAWMPLPYRSTQAGVEWHFLD